MSSLFEIQPCSRKAARYACRHWHYSGRLPASKLFTLGVYEDGCFIGAVVFGLSATPNISRPFGVPNTAACELCRLALSEHHVPTSRIISVALRLLRAQCPGVRFVVSFADPTHGHGGAIYRAAGWIYTGRVTTHHYIVNGRIIHPRSLGAKYGAGGQSVSWLQANIDPKARRVNTWKHRYVTATNRRDKRLLLPMARPFIAIAVRQKC